MYGVVAIELAAAIAATTAGGAPAGATAWPFKSSVAVCPEAGGATDALGVGTEMDESDAAAAACALAAFA